MISTQVLGLRALRWLQVTLAVALIPHLLRLPWWMVALLPGLLYWRDVMARRGMQLPGLWPRFIMVTGFIAALALHYDLPGASVDLFVALLVAGLVFRVMETRTVAQARQLCALSLLVVAAGFIYDQSIPSALHAIVTVVLVLLTWQVLLFQSETLAIREQLGGAVLSLVLAVPIMLVLFVTVPRVGPLWAMPTPDDAATSGITDELAPGGITELGMSDELAFRVGLSDTALVPPSRRYWRGLALDRFDGYRWRRSRSSQLARDGSVAVAVDAPDGQPFRSLDYELIMEPSGRRWVYSLYPVISADSALSVDRNMSLYTERPLIQREQFRLTSALDRTTLTLTGDIGEETRFRSLRLPPDGEPQSRALVNGWLERGLTDRQLVEEALGWFRSQPFTYTLEPPAYGNNDGIDAFLFEGQAGFCSHFASSFAYLMRAAGVPSRVVVGYQGGEPNPYDDYLMVYQYNAHAWVEVWLEGQGWTLIDPTATVAPERIEQGAEEWLRAYGELSGLDPLGGRRNSAWLNALRLRLDSLDYAWNRWVVNFDTESQFNVLESLTGERSERALRQTLVWGVFLVTGALLLGVLWYGRRTHRHPAGGLLRRYGRMLETARRHGSRCTDSDAPAKVSATLSEEWPALEQEIRDVTRQFVSLCYGSGAGRPGSGQRSSRLAWRICYLQFRLALSRPQTCT